MDCDHRHSVIAIHTAAILRRAANAVFDCCGLCCPLIFGESFVEKAYYICCASADRRALGKQKLGVFPLLHP